MGNQIDKLNKKFGKKQAPVKKVPTAIEVKTYIKVAQNKLTLYRNKKVNLIKSKRKEIAHCLRENNLDVAKAKMDSVIKEEDLITVYDILGPLCEILKEKVTYLMTHNECPSDCKAPLDTLIYASSRLEVDELHKLRELIMLKYGEVYVNKGDTNSDGLVNKNLIEKLKVKQTSDTLITIRLKQLCKEDNVPFEFPCEVVGSEFSPFGPGQPGMPPSDLSNPFGPGAPGGNQPFNPYASNIGNYQQGGYNPNMPPQGQNPYGNFGGPNDMGGNNNPYGGNNNPYGGNNNPYGGNNNPYGGNNNPYGGNNNPYGGGNDMGGGFGNFGNFNNNNNLGQSGFGGGFNQYQQNMNNKSGISDFPQNPHSSQMNNNPFANPNNSQMNNNPFANPNPHSSQMNNPYGNPNQSQNNTINPYASQYSNANNISTDIPKNPNQFKQSDFPNPSQVKPNDFADVTGNEFPKNPSQMGGPSDFPKPGNMGPNDFPKNPSQIGDFPKNPSQMGGPSDFPKNPSPMGDFPKNPSQIGGDFPKNPSQIGGPSDFPKNPSTMGDFPKNPSQMGGDFPKNPSNLGPSDFPKNPSGGDDLFPQTPNNTFPKSNDFNPTPGSFPSENPPKDSDFPQNPSTFNPNTHGTDSVFNPVDFQKNPSNDNNPYAGGNQGGFGGFPKQDNFGKDQSVNIPSQSQIPDNNAGDDDLFKAQNTSNQNFNPYSYEYDNPGASNISSVSDQKFVNKPPEEYKKEPTNEKLHTLASQLKSDDDK